MLELRNICKSYKTGDFVQKALDNVSVNFRDSEFVAVLGPSGSGKTTMLNVIGGLARYDEGELVINGVSTREYKDVDWDAYRNHEIGFVFQSYNLIPHQTILSNVELALTLSGISPKERTRKAKMALKEVGLKDHIKKFPNQLSGGQMQRVAIARALVNEPSIIFADEPTGALDTKTSVDVMNVLQYVAKDRLVVMVTHNPELAQQYATRIVKLEDGKITSDTMPFNPDKTTIKQAEENAKIKAKKQRTAMSFLTALSLSFANLMGKKGRTFMTAFAGSIGIIGISAILALSTGTSLYIDNVEHNTLAQYPLSITRSKSLLGDMSESANNGNMSKEIMKMQYNQNEDGKISVRSVLSLLLSTSGKNDLRSLKAYLETNPENINNDVTSIQYSYNTTPTIYANNEYGTYEVYPNSILSMGGSSSSGMSSASSSSMSSGMSASSSSAMGISMSDFNPLPAEDSIYKDKYSVAAGRWPENENECVLVLHKDGSIKDTLLYSLGLRDYKEAQDAMMAYSQNQSTNLPSKFDDVPYNKILGITFKIVNPAEHYVDSGLGFYEDKSSDEAFMKDLVARSQDLKIVGIINAPEGTNTALALYSGINYPYSLNLKSINDAAKFPVVQAQLAKPEVDVLSGKTFAEEKSSAYNVDLSGLSDLVEIDATAIEKAFQFDETKLQMPQIQLDQSDIIGVIASALTPEKISEIIAQMSSSQELSAAMQQVLTQATNAFLLAKAQESTLTPEVYFARADGQAVVAAACQAAGIAVTPTVVQQVTEICGQVAAGVIGVIVPAITDSLQNLMQNMFSANGAFTFNPDALSELFKFNLSSDKLKSLSSLFSGSASRTYEGNLSKFGYADTSNPVAITIYPNDFYAKERVSGIIDNYNTKQEESGHSDKVISYTDYAKVLMQSVNTMIDMITAVLIAFVAISLVVSSIMIGIITYISVLERRREIGILRAIGARKRDIFRVFNAETFIVGLVAGIIGIMVTVIGCFPANIIARQIFNVEYDIAVLPVWAGIALIVISVVLTLLAGLIPASSASKKDPVEAINS